MYGFSTEPTEAVHALPVVRTQQQDRTLLHRRWALYYTEKIRWDVNFRNQLNKVCTFQRLDELAYIYSRLKRPSKLAPGTSIYFVNDELGREPLWESNIHGGTFQYRIYTDRVTQYQIIDRLWERTIFAVLGENIQEPAISAIQVTAKDSYAQITVWHFEHINRRTYSRTQLKLGDVFECSVRDFEYTTNEDSLKNKDELRRGDALRSKARNEGPTNQDTHEKKPLQIIVKESSRGGGYRGGNQDRKQRRQEK